MEELSEYSIGSSQSTAIVHSVKRLSHRKIWCSIKDSQEETTVSSTVASLKVVEPKQRQESSLLAHDMVPSE